jgi:hypothetical protein
MFSLLFYSSKQAVLINMKLSPLFTTIIVALSVSSAMARRTGRGWNRDDDDWWGGAFYPTLSPTLSGKSSKSWWGGWKDDGDDDWKGWRGYNHKKQHKKKLHHEKKRNGKCQPLNNAGIGSFYVKLSPFYIRSSQPLGSRSCWRGS